jgi:hypothetical protein
MRPIRPKYFAQFRGDQFEPPFQSLRWISPDDAGGD